MSTQKRQNIGRGIGSVPTHHVAKKRPALANITNNGLSKGPVFESSKLVPCAKIANSKKVSSTSTTSSGFSRITLPAPSNIKPNLPVLNKKSVLNKSNSNSGIFVPQISMDISPRYSETCSVSMDESMSSCDSLKSPEIEYVDNNDIEAVDFIQRNTCSKLFISEPQEVSEILCKRDTVLKEIKSEKIAILDDDMMDPQLCATMACDIYKHLRASEVKKRPSTDFMERVQKDINSSMRAILVDWLVEVSEEYRFVPDTLYLTINYIDRYLSGNSMDRQRLQLLGVACMMIAAKYEEICAPQVEEFCYITDYTYFKDEVLQMESNVLNFLKFEMTAPTAKCFLRRFVRAALAVVEAPPMKLECLSNYLAELSQIEYNMLRYAPSLVAASAIFLANYILLPSKRPWNSTLRHYTLYQPSELRDCVKALHSLCCNSHSSSLPAIREKYSQHKYKFVATKYCPPSIPFEYFQNFF